MPKFDEVDELCFLIGEERPLDISEFPVDEPAYEMDEDDVESILLDTYTFLEDLQKTQRAKWEQTEIRLLLARIHDMLAWHKLQ